MSKILGQGRVPDVVRERLRPEPGVFESMEHPTECARCGDWQDQSEMLLVGSGIVGTALNAAKLGNAVDVLLSSGYTYREWRCDDCKDESFCDDVQVSPYHGEVYDAEHPDFLVVIARSNRNMFNMPFTPHGPRELPLGLDYLTARTQYAVCSRCGHPMKWDHERQRWRDWKG